MMYHQENSVYPDKEKP